MKPSRQAHKPYQLFVLRYVPNPVVGEFINFGVILVEKSGFAGARFCDLNRITRLDPRADVEVLQGVENEIRDRLKDSHGREIMLHTFTDSLSNLIQISQPVGCFTNDPERELELLAHMYLT